MKKLLLGNEAIAQGAWEAGVRVATAYPGTPSTEITEAVARLSGVQAQWSPNEKVALEVAIGAALGGARAMCCMKHVGVNVAADPLFTVSYTGMRAGLVIVAADDPGMHSSQNEQDSRYYALAAHIPMLEPSDSREARDFMGEAYRLSEACDTPVMVRLTTRISHASGLVEVGERIEAPLAPYEKDIMKYVMMPGMARVRHVAVSARMEKLAADADAMDKLNPMQMRDEDIGIIVSGIAYQYVREALPRASTLKLGLVHPLPMGRIADFAARVKNLYIVEELEPIIENQVRAAGIACRGKELFTDQGEYSVAMIAAALGGAAHGGPAAQPMPARPPVLCPGCPHRGLYYVLNKMKYTVSGDIGCYTLGALKPHNAMDACVCMGASIGMALGMEKARGREFARRLVAVIGDSTFVHSGITGLIDVVYNGGNTTVMILDNSTTGMTGHQDHPGTGRTLQGESAPPLDLTALCRAVGVQDIQVVDPFDTKALEAALRHCAQADGPKVIISRRPCALLDRKGARPPLSVDAGKCVNCRLCMRLGCPALAGGEKGVSIIAAQCVGCGLCAGLCPRGAIGAEVEK